MPLDDSVAHPHRRTKRQKHSIRGERDTRNDSSRLQMPLVLHLGNNFLGLRLSSITPTSINGNSSRYHTFVKSDGLYGILLACSSVITWMHNFHLGNRLFNSIKEVTLVTFTVTSYHISRLSVGKIFQSVVGKPMEFNPYALIVFVNKTVCMTAKTMHCAVGFRNTTVTHDDCYLVDRLWQD